MNVARGGSSSATRGLLGERWEIEFLADGSVDVERFVSTGTLCGPEALDELFSIYAE